MLNYASRWSAVGCTNSTTKKWLDTAGLLMEVADDTPGTCQRALIPIHMECYSN